MAKEIKITEKKTLAKEVSITFPKEWNVTDSDEVEGFFSIVVLRYAPHRMEALAEALKRLGVIGEPIGALFRLSPEWEISNCDHMTHTITLQKYEYSYEYQKK